MKRTIIALGGGGFSMEPDNPLLDDYIVEATGKPRPRIAFLPTASGDSDNYVSRFYAAFARKSEANHLALFNRKVSDVEAFLLAQDAIFVGGGNTANMLAVWRVHGVDRALRRAWEKGVLLSGVSAGALCWFEGGVTDSFGGYQPLRDGLAFLPGFFCPHYDGESARQPVYRDLVRSTGVPGLAAEDGVAIRFENQDSIEAVSSRPPGRAFRFKGEGQVPIDVRFLGKT